MIHNLRRQSIFTFMRIMHWISFFDRSVSIVPITAHFDLTYLKRLVMIVFIMILFDIAGSRLSSYALDVIEDLISSFRDPVIRDLGTNDIKSNEKRTIKIVPYP